MVLLVSYGRAHFLSATSLSYNCLFDNAVIQQFTHYIDRGTTSYLRQSRQWSFHPDFLREYAGISYIVAFILPFKILPVGMLFSAIVDLFS